MELKKLKSVPKSFRLVKKATTAPLGYRLYTDRKVNESRFTTRTKRFVLVKKK